MGRPSALSLPAALLAVFAATAGACGGTTPAPSTPPAATPPPRPSTDGNRPLTKDECGSLAQLLANACQTRPNERSARVEGWCSEILRGVDDGSWVTHECLTHIKYMDAECLRSESNVHGLMDCDKAVDRSR